MEHRLPGNTLFRFATISPLGDLEFEGIAATDTLKADGYQLDMAGADISRFKDGKAPLLLQHDSNRIIGTSGLRKTAHSLILRGKFASPGVSSVADEARRLLKDGVLNSISLGFAVKESERLGKSPRDGIRATKLEAGVQPGRGRLGFRSGGYSARALAAVSAVRPAALGRNATVLADCT